MNLQEELLKRALDSILNGHTVTYIGSDGEVNETKVNDLRYELVARLAKEIVSTRKLADILDNEMTREVVDKILENISKTVAFRDLPYEVRNVFEAKIKKADTETYEYKIVAIKKDE